MSGSETDRLGRGLWKQLVDLEDALIELLIAIEDHDSVRDVQACATKIRVKLEEEKLG